MNPEYTCIKNHQIFQGNYNIFHKDRLTDNYGGVFQAVNNDVIVTRQDNLDANCEIIWTQCQIKNKGSKSSFLASFFQPSMRARFILIHIKWPIEFE